MNSEIERRLAAILAADVAGYSRLMGQDEIATLQALKAHRRELIDPTIAKHHGRIVKTTGDGMLVEFASIVDAVGCAVRIQRAMIGATSLRFSNALFPASLTIASRAERAWVRRAEASVCWPVWRKEPASR